MRQTLLLVPKICRLCFKYFIDIICFVSANGAVFVSVHFLVSELCPAVLSSNKKMYCGSVVTGQEFLKRRTLRIDEHRHREILNHHASYCFCSEVVIGDRLGLNYTL